MHAMLATFTITPDHAAAFEAEMTALAATVLAQEPGTRLYQLCRPRDETGSYTLMELYDDQAAFDAHMASPYLKEAGGRLRPLMGARPVLSAFDTVG